MESSTIQQLFLLFVFDDFRAVNIRNYIHTA
jgi:hypothetical protein